MVNQPKVGLVTVTFNSEKVLDGFYKSIFDLNYDNYKLYIIDNASSDKTLDIIAEQHHKNTVLIPNQSNVGVAAANNQGIKLALTDNCEYILLINNDTEFEADLVQKLVASLDGTDLDIAVPKIMFWDDKTKIWSAGGYFRKWVVWQGSHFSYGKVDGPANSEQKIIEYSPTCCMLIKSSVFSKIGLMDEKYFVYWDDTDFCFRASKSGIKMVYIPEIDFYHKVASLTGGKGSAFTTRYQTRNLVYFVRKNCISFSYLRLFSYFIFLIIKHLMLLDSNEIFKIKKKAFFEGLALKIDDSDHTNLNQTYSRIQ
jgi:GT2 family glycosyltransferase